MKSDLVAIVYALMLKASKQSFTVKDVKDSVDKHPLWFALHVSIPFQVTKLLGLSSQQTRLNLTRS
jgi:hypothetical protein